MASATFEILYLDFGIVSDTSGAVDIERRCSVSPLFDVNQQHTTTSRIFDKRNG